MFRKFVALPFVVALAPAFAGFAAAQDLTGLLPEETFLALGMQDLAGASDQLGDFSAEFRRLDVLGAFTALMDSGSASGGEMSGGAVSGSAASGRSALDEMSPEEKQVAETLSSLEVLGQEAWIALSASSFSPLPALTLVTQVTPEGAQEVQALLDSAGTEGAETLTESGATFYQLPIGGAEPLEVVAYTLTDDLLALSTNPDELRGVLRRYEGADEPNFGTAQSYQDTLGTLDESTFYGFLDYARIADVAAPYTQNLGFEELVNRLAQAFRTAGAVGSTLQLTGDGLISENFQATDQSGGDAALYALLSDNTAATTDVTVPNEALSFSAAAVDLSGWYDYLNDLALSVPELGGDLDSLVLSFTGLNLRESIFSWTGEQLASATTGLSSAVEPGVPSENLLGETAYLIEATNAAAAERGLGDLFQNVSRVAGSLSAPQGEAAAPQRTQETLAGVDVTRFEIMPGTAIFYAVDGGYAVIGTSEGAMTAALTAQAEGGRDDLFNDVPGGATSYAYTDDQATLKNLSETIGSQLQTAAGMSGAGNLDFAAVEKASGVAEEFLSFVASRLSSSTGYSERSNDGIRGRTETAVSWQE